MSRLDATTTRTLLGLLIVAGGVLAARPPAREYLPVVGGLAGAAAPAFSRTCPDDHVLTGVRFRVGMAIDAIGIKCRPVLGDGTLGAQIDAGSNAGGTGGLGGSASCPSGSVVIGQLMKPGIPTSLEVLMLYCGPWYPLRRAWGDRPVTETLNVKAGGTASGVAYRQCSATLEPARGIRGRAGSLIDAAGLICDLP